MNERTFGIGVESGIIGPNAPLSSRFDCTEGNENPDDSSTLKVDREAWLRRIKIKTRISHIVFLFKDAYHKAVTCSVGMMMVAKIYLLDH